VIAIIGILVGVLLPAISTVRTKARNTDAAAQFNSISAGLEAYRGESALGSAYPPSASDNTGSGAGINRFMIADPHSMTPAVNLVVNGAHLLVHAMVGADLLGPPGFRDFDRTAPDGFWSDDTHRGVGGAYEISPTGEVLQTRYGGPGGSYVDDKMKSRTRTLKQLEEEGHIAALNQSSVTNEETYDEPVFIDAWERPILYYRANPSAKFMITGPQAPGIYRQDDNAVITGGRLGTMGLNLPGIDFGAARNARGDLHDLTIASTPDPNPVQPNGNLNDAAFDGSFARFIWDRGIKALNQPVRKDSYLLISAGADGRYGTLDDVTNWQRADN
jgi:type II secretory pathway pseudopilin PulG